MQMYHLLLRLFPFVLAAYHLAFSMDYLIEYSGTSEQPFDLNNHLSSRVPDQ